MNYKFVKNTLKL